MAGSLREKQEWGADSAHLESTTDRVHHCWLVEDRVSRFRNMLLHAHVSGIFFFVFSIEAMKEIKD
jgi:hypothetical protein